MPGNIELAVYNIAGQRVRTMIAGATPAGNHSVVWNGRDDRGCEARCGVDIIRAAGFGRTIIGRLAKIM